MTTLASTQLGGSIGGSWFEGFGTLGGGNPVGIQFQLSNPLDTISSLAVTFSVLSATAGDVVVRVRSELDPGAFADGNLPETGEGITLATFTDPFALAATATFTIPLAAGANSTAFRNNFDTVASRFGRAGWVGRVALSITDTLAAPVAVVATGATLAVGAVPAISGLDGPGSGRSRPDACPKCGDISLRETWVRDGYTRMMVCPNAGCWDPPDLVGRRTPRPRRPLINEG